MFRPWPNSLYTDSFTPKSFVSHNTTVPREQLAEIDLLPKIKNKILLISELSPIFAKRDDELIELLGILTRVLDGQGYESDSGAHGHRGYTGEFMFVLIGAAVDIPRRVHKHLATLGPKLYFLRLKSTQKSEDEYLTNIKKDDFKFRTNAIREVLIDYLCWFEACPSAQIENNLVKIEWAADKDEEQASRIIIRLGILLSHLRGAVSTWETDDTQGLDYAYTLSTIEKPDRAMTQLRNLARGHALTQGRNYINLDDIPLLIEVVLSTASRERVGVFDLLINHNGVLQTSDITSSLNTSDKTAKRTMAEFIALGLVELKPNSYERTIELKKDFDWFLSDDFKKLRQPAAGYEEQKGPSANQAENSDQSAAHYNIFQSCYYCDRQLTTKPEYELHIVASHKGKPAYPGISDIKKYGLKRQGKIWEI
jgi:hypothetical protein